MTYGLFLEAEVPPTAQATFAAEYLRATGTTITPGMPAEYQSQPNKWGAELRIYFNDASAALLFRAAGWRVEDVTSGHQKGVFSYRVNNNQIWWELVRNHGLVLGMN